MQRCCATHWRSMYIVRHPKGCNHSLSGDGHNTTHYKLHTQAHYEEGEHHWILYAMARALNLMDGNNESRRSPVDFLFPSGGRLLLTPIKTHPPPNTSGLRNVLWCKAVSLFIVGNWTKLCLFLQVQTVELKRLRQSNSERWRHHLMRDIW